MFIKSLRAFYYQSVSFRNTSHLQNKRFVLIANVSLTVFPGTTQSHAMIHHGLCCHSKSLQWKEQDKDCDPSGRSAIRGLYFLSFFILFYFIFHFELWILLRRTRRFNNFISCTDLMCFHSDLGYLLFKKG